MRSCAQIGKIITCFVDRNEFAFGKIIDKFCLELLILEELESFIS